MRRLTKPVSAVAATLLWASAAVAGPTLAQSCRAEKNKLAGSYAGCRHKAEARLVTTGDTAGDTDAIDVCTTKLDAKWPLLEQRAIANSGALPSGGDPCGIQAGTNPA